jgi:RHS repeat-associated protein
VDAGGGELASSFYVDNQLQSQSQEGETIGYTLDPADRTSEIVSTGRITADEVLHYAGPGASTPAWTGELSGNWSRDIPGIDGQLAALQRTGEAPVLQITNLHGDVVATAQDSETAGGLESTVAEASEWGVPATEAPPKYSWLGAHEIPTELPSGIQAMGVRSYVPELGRFLQPDPVPGGSANSYAYTNGNPVNETDLNGQYTATFSAALTETLNQEAAQAVAAAVAAEEAARLEAERYAAAIAANTAAEAALEAS